MLSTKTLTTLTADCTTQPSPASVTLLHEDFEHLLKLAHEEATPSSASVVCTSISGNGVSSKRPWLVDSGATDHMANTPHLFSAFTSFKTPLMVRLANGSKVPAIGKGQVAIQPHLLLHDVLIAPSFPIMMQVHSRENDAIRSFATKLSNKEHLNYCHYQLKNKKKSFLMGIEPRIYHIKEEYYIWNT